MQLAMAFGRLTSSTMEEPQYIYNWGATEVLSGGGGVWKTFEAIIPPDSHSATLLTRQVEPGNLGYFAKAFQLLRATPTSYKVST